MFSLFCFPLFALHASNSYREPTQALSSSKRALMASYVLSLFETHGILSWKNSRLSSPFFIKFLKTFIMYCCQLSKNDRSRFTLCNHFTLLRHGNNYHGCSINKSVLKSFAMFTRKQLCWSLFQINLQVWIIICKGFHFVTILLCFATKAATTGVL